MKSRRTFFSRSSFWGSSILLVAAAAGCAATEAALSAPPDASSGPGSINNNDGAAKPNDKEADAEVDAPADDASFGVTDASDASPTCASPAPAVYHVKYVGTAGGPFCADRETTIDLTPEGIADAASKPPPFDAGDIDASSCVLVPSPPCTFKTSCPDTGDSIFVQTYDPITSTGTSHWTLLRPDGGVLLDCTWSVTYTKLR
jgi:hypothetical protein